MINELYAATQRTWLGNDTKLCECLWRLKGLVETGEFPTTTVTRLARLARPKTFDEHLVCGMVLKNVIWLATELQLQLKKSSEPAKLCMQIIGRMRKHQWKLDELLMTKFGHMDEAIDVYCLTHRYHSTPQAVAISAFAKQWGAERSEPGLSFVSGTVTGVVVEEELLTAPAASHFADKNITLRLGTEFLRQIDAAARASYVSRSAWIKFSLSKILNAKSEKPHAS